MSSRLDLRVAKLERALGAGGVDLRIYGSAAEADADTRPAEPGMEIHVIITGVVRAPGWRAGRYGRTD
jgi:hypothetical protein